MKPISAKKKARKKLAQRRSATAATKRIKKKLGDQSIASSDPNGSWVLRLYVAGNTERCASSISNLKAICESHLHGRYTLEVIDLLRSPQLAQGDQILAIPTLIRQLPGPVKRIIGDLSNLDRVIVGLDLRPSDMRA